MIFKKHKSCDYYMVTCSNSEYNVHSNSEFKDGPLPIVWNYRGLIGIIPRERVSNLIRYLADVSNLPGIDAARSVTHIQWNDVARTTNDPNEIADIISELNDISKLCSDEGNNNSNHRGNQ